MCDFESLRSFLLPYVMDGTQNVAIFQKLCGIHHEHNDHDKRDGYRISNKFLYYYFSAAASVGNETFYILFLPFLFWCVDTGLGRRFIVLWVAVYYVGQSIKDKLKLPRPVHAISDKDKEKDKDKDKEKEKEKDREAKVNYKVVTLETHYGQEYGMPSTHSMIAVAFPFYIFFFLTSSSSSFLPFSSAWFLSLSFSLVWSLSVCTSRLYMGVHSLADIVVGVFLGVLLLFLYIYVVGDARLDEVFVSERAAPATLFMAAVILVLIYPYPKRWTNAYGDTSLIVATGFGVLFGSSIYLTSFAHSFGYSLAPCGFALVIDASTSPSTLSVKVDGFIFLMRGLVGASIIILTRKLVKMAAKRAVVAIHKAANISFGDPDKTYSVEIPVKCIVYTCVGFNATFTAPFVFEVLGIKSA